MKFLFALILMVTSSIALAYGPKNIDGWSNDFELKQNKASDLIFDFYIFSVWWEDEGYECGGEFSDAQLISKEANSYTVAGNVTVVQNYCASTSLGSYVVKISKVNGKYQVKEISWDEGYLGNNK